MSEQVAPPHASPQPGTRAALAIYAAWVRRAINERGACGGVAVDELAELSEAPR